MQSSDHIGRCFCDLDVLRAVRGNGLRYSGSSPLTAAHAAGTSRPGSRLATLMWKLSLIKFTPMQPTITKPAAQI